jgi:HMG (high mobility group) box
MPKRPLSAYNLFFKSQRQELLGNDATQFPINDQAKRKHRKTHGKIGFEEMAKSVGQKWKNLDEASRSIFEREAAIEKEKYNEAMGEYSKMKRKSSLPDITAVQDTNNSSSGTNRTDLVGAQHNSLLQQDSISRQLPESSLQYDDNNLNLNNNLLNNLLATRLLSEATANNTTAGRMLLDDSSFGGGRSVNTMLDNASELLRSQYSHSSGRASLPTNFGRDRLTQLLDDSSRSNLRRTTASLIDMTSGIEGRLGSAMGVPQVANPRDRLSLSTTFGTNVGLDNLSHDRLGYANASFMDREMFGRSATMIDRLQSSGSRRISSLGNLQQADEEYLLDYYRSLLQETAAVREELDHRFINRNQSSGALPGEMGSRRLSQSTIDGLEHLRATGGMVSTGALPLPLFDNINMPPVSRTQLHMERQAELFGRARQVQNHIQQQRQVESLIELERRYGLDNRFGRRISTDTLATSIHNQRHHPSHELTDDSTTTAQQHDKRDLPDE